MVLFEHWLGICCGHFSSIFCVGNEENLGVMHILILWTKLSNGYSLEKE